MTPDEIRSLITRVKDIPPFPPAGAAWQAGFFHKTLISLLEAAATEPDSALSTVLIANITEYLARTDAGAQILRSADGGT